MISATLQAQLEALLFIAGEAVALSRLAKTLNVSREAIEEAVERLRSDCSESPERGVMVVIREGMVEMVTRPEYGALVSAWMQAGQQESLSKAALEVLAIIAYRGPITRSAIELIRGVNCQITLRNLLLRGLIDRNDEEDIRGYTYVLSADCYKQLGISRKEDLPDYTSLSRSERIEALEQATAEFVEHF